MNPELPFIIFGSLGMASLAAWVLRPLVVGWGKRLEGNSAPALRAELDQQRQEQQRELEVVHQRVAELEERLEFTERLLAQPAERRQFGA